MVDHIWFVFSGSLSRCSGLFDYIFFSPCARVYLFLLLLRCCLFEVPTVLKQREVRTLRCIGVDFYCCVRHFSLRFESLAPQIKCISVFILNSNESESSIEFNTLKQTTIERMGRKKNARENVTRKKDLENLRRKSKAVYYCHKKWDYVYLGTVRWHSHSCTLCALTTVCSVQYALTQRLILWQYLMPVLLAARSYTTSRDRLKPKKSFGTCCHLSHSSAHESTTVYAATGEYIFPFFSIFSAILCFRLPVHYAVVCTLILLSPSMV